MATDSQWANHGARVFASLGQVIASKDVSKAMQQEIVNLFDNPHEALFYIGDVLLVVRGARPCLLVVSETSVTVLRLSNGKPLTNPKKLTSCDVVRFPLVALAFLRGSIEGGEVTFVFGYRGERAIGTLQVLCQGPRLGELMRGLSTAYQKLTVSWPVRATDRAGLRG